MGTGLSSFSLVDFYKKEQRLKEYYKEHFKEIYEEKMNDSERRQSVAEGYARYKATGDVRLKVYETWQKSYDNYDDKE